MDCCAFHEFTDRAGQSMDCADSRIAPNIDIEHITFIVMQISLKLLAGSCNANDKISLTIIWNQWYLSPN